MKQLEFSYTEQDEKINKQILTIKNIWILKRMLLNRFWLKLIISVIIGFSMPIEIENYQSIYLQNFEAYLLLFVFFIIAYLFCTFCYSCGARGNYGFLTVSQKEINKIGTTITINNDGLTIKRDNNYLFANGRKYRWRNIRAIKLCSNCILCQMSDYFIVILPKRIFEDFADMLSYYNEIKSSKFSNN